MEGWRGLKTASDKNYVKVKRRCGRAAVTHLVVELTVLHVKLIDEAKQVLSSATHRLGHHFLLLVQSERPLRIDGTRCVAGVSNNH